jgi:hypothetical protein
MTPNQKRQLTDINRWFVEKLSVLLSDASMRYELIDGIDSDDAKAQVIVNLITIAAGLIATRTSADSIKAGRHFARLIYKIRMADDNNVEDE